MSNQRSQQDGPVFEPEPDVAGSLHGNTDGDPRVALALELLNGMAETMSHVQSLLGGQADEAQMRQAAARTSRTDDRKLQDVSGCRVVEGVFDGKSMIGTDGKSYRVPPNYASKSRLVEGDVLKLTINPDGRQVYKQIGPIQRERHTGKLAYDASADDFVVVCDSQTYKVLRASVTYFNGEPGDEVIVLVPESSACVWAAVENIMKRP